MAYVQPTYDQIRSQFLNDPAGGPRVTPPSFLGTGGGSIGGSGAGVSGPSVGVASSGGGRFAALQGFLAANAPNANAQALSVAQPIEAEAQQAVSGADTSSRLPGNYGGLDAAAAAQSARDDALSKVNASQTLDGAGTLFGTTGADYSPGARRADAALYGRTQAFQNLGRWAPVLSALSPTYKPDYTWQAPSDSKVEPTSPNQGVIGPMRKILGSPPSGKDWLSNAADEAKKIYTSPPWDW